jgi:hypothetical protein
MLFVRVLGRWERVWAVRLLVAVLALVPLADDSPPDQVWIPGIYDADTDDDVVSPTLSRVEGSRIVYPVSIDIHLAAAPVIHDTLVRSVRTRAPPKS